MIVELEQIKRILWEDRDPIGVGKSVPAWSNDEYDGYALQTFVMLNQGKGLDEIASYLEWVETEHMGLDGSGRHEEIARRIVELNGAGQ